MTRMEKECVIKALNAYAALREHDGTPESVRDRCMAAGLAEEFKKILDAKSGTVTI